MIPYNRYGGGEDARNGQKSAKKHSLSLTDAGYAYDEQYLPIKDMYFDSFRRRRCPLLMFSLQNDGHSPF